MAAAAILNGLRIRDVIVAMLGVAKPVNTILAASNDARQVFTMMNFVRHYCHIDCKEKSPDTSPIEKLKDKEAVINLLKTLLFNPFRVVCFSSFVPWDAPMVIVIKAFQALYNVSKRSG